MEEKKKEFRILSMMINKEKEVSSNHILNAINLLSTTTRLPLTGIINKPLLTIPGFISTKVENYSKRNTKLNNE